MRQQNLRRRGQIAALLLAPALLGWHTAWADSYDYSDPFKQPRLDLPDLGSDKAPKHSEEPQATTPAPTQPAQPAPPPDFSYHPPVLVPQQPTATPAPAATPATTQAPLPAQPAAPAAVQQPPAIEPPAAPAAKPAARPALPPGEQSQPPAPAGDSGAGQFIFTPVQRQSEVNPDGSSPAAPVAPPALRGEFMQQSGSYLAITGQPMLAAAQLLSADELGWLHINKVNPSRLLTSWLQQAGMYRQAAERAQAAQAQWTRFARNEFWLHQGNIWLHRDYPRIAEKALQRVDAPKDSSAANRLNGLMTRSLLYQHRYSSAATQLKALQGQPSNSLYQIYNLAIAWLGMGQTAQGLGALYELGQINALDPEVQALRDRANLMLGWQLLSSKQAGSARAILSRVREHGMDAARARLGLGWAELAPDGAAAKVTLLRPRNCLKDMAAELLKWANALRRPPRDDCHPDNPEIFHHDQVLPFRAGGSKQNRYQQALAAWKPLLDQPIAWGPVRETLLASAQTWHLLGDDTRARDTYQLAVQRLQQEQARVAELITQVNDPAIDPVALLNRDANRHRMLQWRASREYIAALHDRNALRQSMEQLDLDQERLQRLEHDAQTDSAVSTARQLRQRWQSTRAAVDAAYTQLNLTLRQRTEQRLQAEQKDLQQYLTRARLEYAAVLAGPQ